MPRMKASFLFLSFFLTITLTIGQVKVDTIYTTTNKTNWIKKAGDRLAWLESIDGQNVIMLLENNALDTIYPPDGTHIQDFQLSETVVAWTGDIIGSQNGHCSNGSKTSMRYYKGDLHIDNLPCADNVISSDKYIIRTSIASDFIFQVIDTSNQIIFELPENYQNSRINRSFNIYAMHDETIFLKATEVINSDYIINIYKFNIQTKELDRIYQSFDKNKFLLFHEFLYDEYSLAFTENSYESDMSELFYYHNDTVRSISKENSSSHFVTTTFKDGVIYTDNEFNLIYTDGANFTTTLRNCHDLRVPSINQSGCYFSSTKSYFIDGEVHMSYSLFNGNETICYATPGRRDNYGYAQKDNVIYDIIRTGNIKHILRIEFDFECPNENSCQLSYEYGPTDPGFRTKRCLNQPSYEEQVRDSEAFVINNLVLGRKYAFSFCEGYDENIFEARVVIQEYDSENDIIGDVLSDKVGCTHNIRMDNNSQYDDVLIIVSNNNFCQGFSNNLKNGKPKFACAIGRDFDNDDNDFYPSTTSYNDGPGISIFPNPAQDVLNVTSTNVEEYKVIISDVSGNQIWTSKNSKEINLEKFSNGIYLMNIVNEEKNYNYIEKFVVLK